MQVKQIAVSATEAGHFIKNNFMKRDALKQLEEMKQADIIWERGALIGKRADGFYKVLLFQVDAFYAEIFYHTHFNVIIKIRTFSNTDQLEPYLKKIDITALINP